MTSWHGPEYQVNQRPCVWLGPDTKLSTNCTTTPYIAIEIICGRALKNTVWNLCGNLPCYILNWNKKQSSFFDCEQLPSHRSEKTVPVRLPVFTMYFEQPVKNCSFHVVVTVELISADWMPIYQAMPRGKPMVGTLNRVGNFSVFSGVSGKINFVGTVFLCFLQNHFCKKMFFLDVNSFFYMLFVENHDPC